MYKYIYTYMIKKTNKKIIQGIEKTSKKAICKDPKYQKLDKTV